MAHKLLLADDSVTIQRVIELTFADEDIVVIAVGDGRQAIARALAEKPDIVLADVGMPEHDGYEVATFIKNTPELAHIPVLLLTGAFEPIDDERARAARCDGVLVKPFEPQMVITRVKDLIAGKRPEPAAPARSEQSSTPPPFASPEPATAAGSVEEYFDRLNAAFSAKERVPAEPSISVPPGASTDEAGVQGSASELASELAAWEPDLSVVPASHESAPAVTRSSEAPGPVSAGANTPTPATVVQPAIPSLADAFAVLLTAEQAHGYAPPRAPREEPPEDLVDQVTRRVIERLGDSVVRDVVVDVAERLVREEIDKIKAAAS